MKELHLKHLPDQGILRGHGDSDLSCPFSLFRRTKCRRERNKRV